MKYVMLVHQGDSPTPLVPEKWAEVPADEQRQIAADYQALTEAPGMTPGSGLQLPETATTVRVEDGRTLTTDGPFPETKEALGGFFFLEVDDLDAAIEVAAKVPAARLGGGVEIRPVHEW